MAHYDGPNAGLSTANRMAETARHMVQDSSTMRSRPTVLISANSFWNIANFRTALVKALADAGHSIMIATPDPDVDWCRRRGSECVPIQIDRSGMNPIQDMKLIFRYFRLLSNRRCEYLLGFTAKPNIYGSLAARMTGVTSLPNVSGLGTAFMKEGALSRFVGWLYRTAFRTCPVVFFQNPDDRDLFVARRIIRPQQARLLPGSGIDLARFRPMPDSGDGQVRFLFIGRLLGDKGISELVEAARLIKAEHPDWRFQLLGSVDPDNRSGIGPEKVQEWVEQGLVEHLGHVDDVRPHIASATAVVLPSYREGLPRSLLEAAAMARPLVATDVPGNRQLVVDGVTGLLCEVKSAGSLAGAIRRVGTMSDAERSTLGRGARALVEREYGEERVVQAYLDVLTELRSQRAEV